MKIHFIQQGYNTKTHTSVGKLLIEFLSSSDYNSFIGVSAFASQAGIRGLSKYIKFAKERGCRITIITGIDQFGTSKEALDALYELDINSSVYYKPIRPIFHPKLYIFEGPERAEIIVGSSNLTAQGLFANIESSIHVSINTNDQDGQLILSQLKSQLTHIINHTDPNLQKITKKLIDTLVKSKIVPAEKDRNDNISEDIKSNINATFSTITKLFPKSKSINVPKEFRRTFKTTSEKRVIDIKTPQLLWESGPLTKRDLNIPANNNTHLTGSMLFKKGKFKHIDQRHYFRDTVFSSLTWVKNLNPKYSHLEKSSAYFSIIILGVNHGKYNLKLNHNTDKNSRAYLQNNSMTSISWGEVKNIVANSSLIGLTLKLYQISNDEFSLMIE